MIAANSFDAIRLFAALLVVYGHAHPLTNTPSPQFYGNSIQALGVKIFFVISGYLIIGSWQRDPSIFRFFKRRLLRILPGLVLVVFFSAFIVGPFFTALNLKEYFSNSRTLTYLGNIALYPQYDLPGVFLKNPYPVAINGSLWSLPAEVAMYVIGPLVCVLGLYMFRAQKIFFLLATAALMALSIYYLRVDPLVRPIVIYGSSLSSFLDVAPYFMIGGVYSIFQYERRFSLPLACASWIIISLLQVGGYASEVVLYLVLPYVTLTLGMQQTRMGSKVQQFGDISYGVYLYGFLLQQCVASLFPVKGAEPLANTIFTMVPLIIIATLSWRLVEKPILKYKPFLRIH